MHNYSSFSDPIHNFNFRRRWVDDPLDDRGLRHLGRDVRPKVIEAVARRAIGRWLDKASETQNKQSAEAFRQADEIRRNAA